MLQPSPNPITIVLSRLYGSLVWVRQSLYQSSILPTQRLPILVIVVGNVLAGGVGKTPFCIQLIAHLQSLGYRPGLVARGYGRKSNGIVVVGPHTQAGQVGDEAQLIWHKTGVPVVVGTKRGKAAIRLLANYPEINVLVSDDGLQHHALARDVEVVLHDDRIRSHCRLLPAGWLREFWPRRRVGEATEIVLESLPRILDCSRLPGASEYAALAGIGRPQQFFDALKAQGLHLAQTLPLPDHDSFAHGGVFDQWQRMLSKDIPLLCTEKDAVKIMPLYPGLAGRLYPVPLRLLIPPETFSYIETALKRHADLAQKNLK